MHGQQNLKNMKMYRDKFKIYYRISLNNGDIIS